jgi:hypothetical protein
VGRSLSNNGLYRRVAALYGLIFLFAVTLAPHRHFNSLEDLLSDGPSDSGIFVESLNHAPESGPCVSSSRLIDDDPCLACFHNDYAAAASSIFHLSPSFDGLARVSFLFPAATSYVLLISPVPRPAIPEPSSEPSSSRSPP